MFLVPVVVPEAAAARRTNARYPILIPAVITRIMSR